MLINELNITSLLLLTKIPFWPLLLNTFIFSLIISFVLKFFILKNNLLRNIMVTIFFISFLYYFGVGSAILFIFIVFGSILLGLKLFKLENLLLSFIIGFFVFIEVYILIGLIFNLKISMVSLAFMSFILILFKRDQNVKFLAKVKIGLQFYFERLNLFDFWLISLSFIIGSQPQSHWDAIHANLYNAKWYVINNSFKPLAESISSLFPQNAIAYYSFFYQIGQEKMLQLSFLIPLLIIILIFKNVSEIIKLKKSIRWIWYLILFSPIVIFESSNGYYDVLILALLITVLYLIILERKKDFIKDILISSFLIGFATAIRYFPLTVLLLPLTFLFYCKKKKVYLTILVMFFLVFFPLGIWLYRTYVYTGSPTFPFFQSVFPTPKLWTGSELVDNFMIQTTMKFGQWTKGGFSLYPLFSYFKTEQYMEATRGFPGLTYILLIPVQIIIFAKIIINAFYKKTQKKDLLFLSLFLAYFCVGLFSRYYRYIWPFQFLLATGTIIYLTKTLKRLNLFLLLSVTSILLLFNINDTLGFFRFFPIDLEKLWQPNFFQLTTKKTDPISFLNIAINHQPHKKILDISQYMLPRLHFSATVFECNWYWIEGIQKMTAAEKSKNAASNLINQFDYVITANPINSANNFCFKTIANNLTSLKQIYQDKNYLIYKVKK